MRIVFCLPGRSFSGQFIASWTILTSHCLKKGIDIVLSQRYNSNVYYVRAQCLGADVRRGKSQKPWDGKLPYDYMMWIDSDVLFRHADFDKLLSHNKDIVGGLYLMEGGKQFAAVKDWNEETFKTNGSFKFLESPDLPEKGLLEVAYSGFGFLLIKQGVFESIDYPWFSPEHITIGNCVDFASEDVSFCLKARRAGFKIHVDPTVIVGHEKSQILMPSELKV